MINLLIKLKDNLSKNWTYVHKIIFSFSFYLLYKVFVRAIGFDEMKPFALIFVLLGFLIYTADKLIDPIINIAYLISNKEKINEKEKNQAISVLIFFILTIIGVISYYITNYYPLASLSIFSIIMADLITGYFIEFSLISIGKKARIAIRVLFILGIAGVIHSFYFNDFLNIFIFIYIITFFILDYTLDYWKRKYTD